MKKAVALPFVLFFIIAFTTLVLEFTNNFDKEIKHNTFVEILQTNNTIETVKNIINNNLKNISSLVDTDSISVPSITDKKNTVTVSMSGSHKRSLININELYAFKHESSNAIALKNELEWMIDQFAIIYELENANLLFHLIQDTIDEDTYEEDQGSEIVLTNFRYNQGSVYNYEHLKQIINKYYEITDDKKIYDIKFKNIFCFGNECDDALYCRNATKEILQLIIENNTYSAIDDVFQDNCLIESFTTTEQKRLKSLKVNYNEEGNNKLEGTINYKVLDFAYNIDFIYDFNTSIKKVTHINVQSEK